MILAQTVHEIYSSKAIGCGIFGPFSNVDNFHPEVNSDVESGVVVDLTGVKFHVKLDDSRSNRSRDIQLPHFVQTTVTDPMTTGQNGA